MCLLRNFLMSSAQEAIVQMTNYRVPQGSGDIVMIQSEHTGAVDILSAELETADLLGEQRKGEGWDGSTCLAWGWDVFVCLLAEPR